MHLGGSIECNQKRAFCSHFTDKAAKLLYAISHKINYREKESSPWPLVLYNLHDTCNLLLTAEFNNQAERATCLHRGHTLRMTSIFRPFLIPSPL